MAFPVGFLFGVATADHQCEAFEPRWKDERDEWDQDQRLTLRGRATDFWKQYRDDIALARGLGCNAFRFSVSWAKVEPTKGKFDEDVLKHYLDLARAVRDADMEPVVTLHHYTWPLWLQKMNGSLGPEMPELFGRYATKVATSLQREKVKVKYWITINEPTALVYGYLKSSSQGAQRMPPGVPPGTSLDAQLQMVEQLMTNLFRANRAAREAIQAVDKHALVSANPLIFGLPGWLQRWLDLRAKWLRVEPLKKFRREAVPRLRFGRGDVDCVIAQLTATATRGTSIDFSTPYEIGSLRMLVMPHAAIDRFEDAKAVAVLKGSSAEEAVAGLAPDALVVPVASYGDGLAKCRAGYVDGVLIDSSLASEYLGAGAWRMIDDSHPQRYVVGMSKEAGDLREVVNRVVSGSKAAAVSGPTLDSIRRRGVLIVGVRKGDDAEDSSSGSTPGDLDLAMRIAEAVLGDATKVQLEPLGIEERVSKLKSIPSFLANLVRLIDLFVTANNGSWWHLGIAGQLPAALCPVDCRYQQDFVGFDYYWGLQQIGWRSPSSLGQVASGNFQNAPVWPGGMRVAIDSLHRLFPHQSLLVVENGSVVKADGVERVAYLKTHLAEVERAVQKGRPLIGYLCWTITSNREWGLAFAPGNDFGLYHIELDRDPSLKRTETESASTYRAFIAAARS
jgi:beta-glucosidase/6-phospho-beta-glucosidase/beta-galactosidase/ABC-type amino acid transport substrate-binding protein